MPDINSFFPSSYLRAADLPQPRVLTMTDVVSETFDDGTSKPCVGFQEITQRLGLNKTNANSIAQLYGGATEGLGRQTDRGLSGHDALPRAVDAMRPRPGSRRLPDSGDRPRHLEPCHPSDPRAAHWAGPTSAANPRRDPVLIWSEDLTP